TRALDAATNAISSPLLDDVSIHGARGVLINITGGYNLALQEVDEAATVVRDMAHEDAIIVFGAVLDESMEDTVRVTVVATGIGTAEKVAFPGEEKRGATAGAVHAAGGRPMLRRPALAVPREEVPVSAPPPPPPVEERPQQMAPRRGVRRVANGGEELSEQSLDIPTFLRRQMD
ncbi:MAG: cell division protein FtsZ, partial [Magnetococcales bacterium]|nr:cell division protein FtsZ [Magnetococcales bacterium]